MADLVVRRCRAQWLRFALKGAAAAVAVAEVGASFRRSQKGSYVGDDDDVAGLCKLIPSSQPPTVGSLTRTANRPARLAPPQAKHLNGGARETRALGVAM